MSSEPLLDVLIEDVRVQSGVVCQRADFMLETLPALLSLNFTVVDVSAFGKSTDDIHDAAVIVENGRITAVGPRRSTKVPLTGRSVCGRHSGAQRSAIQWRSRSTDGGGSPANSTVKAQRDRKI